MSEPARLGNGARRAIDEAEHLLVSAISVWEVTTLVRRERLVLDRDVRSWVEQALSEPRLRAAPVDASVAQAAGSLPDAFPGDPADRLIYATALVRRAPLVTRDERIAAFDPTRCRW